MVSLKEKEINHTHMIDTKICYSQDIKQAIIDYDLWCDIVDESYEYLHLDIWKEINNFDYPINSLKSSKDFIFICNDRLIYFQNEYDLKIGLDDREKGFKNIFGDWIFWELDK